MSIEKLTPAQVEAMAGAANGADIYSPRLAADLRKAQSACPDLIAITNPQAYEGDGTDRMPYFGAILTDLGRQFIKEVET